MGPAFISWSSESRFFRWWILIAAGDTRVPDPVDTVHHEMDSTVHSHIPCSYVSIFVVTSNRRTTRSREGACWSIHMINMQYVTVIKDSQIVGHTLSEIYLQITWYYITQRGSVVRCLASVILLGKEDRKGLEEPCKFNYYCELTKDLVLTRTLVFIKPGARWPQTGMPGFLKLILCRSSVCVYVSAPEAINSWWCDVTWYGLHMIG